MGDFVVTRVRRTGPPRRSRTFDERLIARFPSLYRRGAAVFFGRLSPRNRLRRMLLRRGVLSGWASFDRRDYELNLVFFAPDVEFEFPAALHALGLSDEFRGHAGRIEALEKIYEVWDVSDLEPTYILDLGNRFLNLGVWRAHARASGVPLEQEFAQLITVQDGLVTRDQNFFSWEDGLRAAGLDPHAIPRVGRLASTPLRR